MLFKQTQYSNKINGERGNSISIKLYFFFFITVVWQVTDLTFRESIENKIVGEYVDTAIYIKVHFVSH